MLANNLFSTDKDAGFFWATLTNQISGVEAVVLPLLARNVHINKEFEGEHIIHYAAAHPFSAATMSAMLDAGMDPHAVSSTGDNVLHFAARHEGTYFLLHHKIIHHIQSYSRS